MVSYFCFAIVVVVVRCKKSSYQKLQVKKEILRSKILKTTEDDMSRIYFLLLKLSPFCLFIFR